MGLLVKEGVYHVQLKTNQATQFIVFPNVYIKDHVHFGHGVLSFSYGITSIHVPIQEIHALKECDPD
jgi:hypothetical protein